MRFEFLTDFTPLMPLIFICLVFQNGTVLCDGLLYRISQMKEKITKFRAPRDEKQFILWQKAIPRSDRKLTKQDYVCAKHFKDKDLTKERTIFNEVFPLKIWKLAAEAIPTLNLCNCSMSIILYLK